MRLDNVIISFLRKQIRRNKYFIDLAGRIMWNPTIKRWENVIAQCQAAPIKTNLSRLLIVTSDPYSLIGSLGDHAMITALITAARKKNKHVEIAVVTGSPRADKAAYYLGIKPLQIWSLAAFPGKILRDIGEYSPDVVAVIGADVMDGLYNPYLPLQQIIVADISARLGARSFICGFSFNENAFKHLKKVFELAHPSVIFNVRDPVSFFRFTSFCSSPAKLVADAAFSLQPSKQSSAELEVDLWSSKRHKAGDIVLAVNLHPVLLGRMSRDLSDSLFTALGQCLELVSKQRKVSWVLLPHDYRGEIGDMAMLEPLYSKLALTMGDSCYLLNGEHTAADLKAVAAHIDGVISARMHLAIACLGMGKPLLAITYQGKFLGLLKHFDLPEWLLTEPRDILDVPSFEKKVLRFIDELPSLTQRVTTNLPTVLKLSASNFDTI